MLDQSIKLTDGAVDRGKSMGNLVGEMIGPYRIECEIGRGGMGTVFRAAHASLDRVAALKLLPLTGLSDEGESRERFLREARTAAKLNHPNIVQVYDAGTSGPFLYIAMEFVDGKDLQRVLNDRRVLPAGESLRIVRACAEALQMASSKGVVHRDVKPSNILCASSGQVKLADFGLAKVPLPGDGSLTSPGTVLGTPMYMSPEQLLGGPLDHRSDIYALGLVFLELLSGRPPFEPMSTADLLRERIRSPNALPTALMSGGLPSGARAVVERMVDPSPDRRTANYDALLSDLDSLKGLDAALVGPESDIASVERFEVGKDGGCAGGPVHMDLDKELRLDLAELVNRQVLGGNCTEYVASHYEARMGLWERGEAAGSPQGMVLMSFCYHNGYGKPKDEARAISLLERAAATGHADACNFFGATLDNGILAPRDIRRAVELYAKAAEGGSLVGQYNLAVSLGEGEGGPIDREKAFYWLRKSAEGGFVVAQLLIGTFYLSGTVVPRSTTEAVRWFKMAAEEEFAPALIAYAECLFEGTGVKTQKKEGIRLLKIAAEKGSVDAEAKLADRYFEADGVSNNEEKGMKWLIRAADHGHAEAQCLIASFYKMGVHVPQDRQMAIKYFKMAANQGVEQAGVEAERLSAPSTPVDDIKEWFGVPSGGSGGCGCLILLAAIGGILAGLGGALGYFLVALPLCLV